MSLFDVFADGFGTPVKKLGTVAYSLYSDLSNNKDFFGAVYNAVQQEMAGGSTGGKTLNWVLSMNPQVIDMTPEEVVKDPIMAMTKGLIFKMSEMGADSYVSYLRQGFDRDTAIKFTNANLFQTKTEILNGMSMAEAITTPGMVGYASNIMSYTDKSGEVSTMYPFISIGDGSVMAKTFTGILDTNMKTGDRLDVGNALGAFLQSAGERTLMGSVITKVYDYLSGNSPSLVTDYRAAAMQENLEGSPESAMLGKAAKTAATVLGYAGSIAENILAAKTGGTVAMFGLNVGKGRLVDYEYSTGMQERFNAKKWTNGLVFDAVTTGIGLSISQYLATGITGMAGNPDFINTIGKMLRVFKPSTITAVGLIPVWQVGINTAVDMGIDYGFHQATKDHLEYSQYQMNRYDLSGTPRENASKLANEFMFRSAMVIGSGVARNFLAKQSGTADSIFSMPWFKRQFGGEANYDSMARFRLKAVSLMWNIYPGNVKAIDQMLSNTPLAKSFVTRLKEGQLSFRDYIHYWALAERQSNTLFRWLTSATGAVDVDRLTGIMVNPTDLAALGRMITNLNSSNISTIEQAGLLGKVFGEHIAQAIKWYPKDATTGMVNPEDALRVVGNAFHVLKGMSIGGDNVSEQLGLDIREAAVMPLRETINDLAANNVIDRDTAIGIMSGFKLDVSAGRENLGIGIEGKRSENLVELRATEDDIIKRIRAAEDAQTTTNPGYKRLLNVSEEEFRANSAAMGELVKMLEGFSRETRLAGTAKLDASGKLVADLDAEGNYKYHPMFKTWEVMLKSLDEVDGENLFNITMKLATEGQAMMQQRKVGSFVEYLDTLGLISAKLMKGEYESLVRVMDDPKISYTDKVLAAVNAKRVSDTLQALFFKYASPDSHKELKNYLNTQVEDRLKDIRSKFADTKIGGVDASDLYLDLNVYEQLNFVKSAISPFVTMDPTLTRNLGIDYEQGFEHNFAGILQAVSAYSVLPGKTSRLNSLIDVLDPSNNKVKLMLDEDTIALSIAIYRDFMLSQTSDAMRYTATDITSILAAMTHKYVMGKYVESHLPNKAAWGDMTAGAKKDVADSLKNNYGIELVSFDEATNKIQLKFMDVNNSRVSDAFEAFMKPVVDHKQLLTPGLIDYELPATKRIYRFFIDGRPDHGNVDNIYRSLINAYPEFAQHASMIVANGIDLALAGKAGSINTDIYLRFKEMLSRKIGGFSIESDDGLKLGDQEFESLSRALLRRAVETQDIDLSMTEVNLNRKLYLELGANMAAINRTTNFAGLDYLDSYTVNIKLVTSDELTKITDIMSREGYKPVSQPGNTMGNLVFARIAASANEEIANFQAHRKAVLDIYNLERTRIGLLSNDYINADYRYYLSIIGQDDYNDRVDAIRIGGKPLSPEAVALLKDARLAYVEASNATSTNVVQKALGKVLVNLQNATALIAKAKVGPLNKAPVFGKIRSRLSNVKSLASSEGYRLAGEWQKWYDAQSGSSSKVFDLDSTTDPLAVRLRTLVDMIADPSEKAMLEEFLKDPDRYDTKLTTNAEHGLGYLGLPTRLATLLESSSRTEFDVIESAIGIVNQSGGNTRTIEDAVEMLTKERRDWESGARKALFGQQAVAKVTDLIDDVLNDISVEVNKIADLDTTQSQKYPATFDLAKLPKDEVEIRNLLYTAYLTKNESLGISPETGPKRFSAETVQRVMTGDEVDNLVDQVWKTHGGATIRIIDSIKTATGQEHDGEILMKSWMFKLLQNSFAVEGLTVQAFNSLMKVSLVSDDSIDADIVIHTGAVKKVDPLMAMMIKDGLFDGNISNSQARELMGLFFSGMAKQSDVYERTDKSAPSSQTSNYGSFGSIIIDRAYDLDNLRNSVNKVMPRSYSEYINTVLAKTRNMGEVVSTTSRLMSDPGLDNFDSNNKTLNALDAEMIGKYGKAGNRAAFSYEGQQGEILASIQFASGVSIISLARQVSKMIGVKPVYNGAEADIHKVVQEVFKRANEYDGTKPPDPDWAGINGKKLLEYLSGKRSQFVKMSVDVNGTKHDAYANLNVRYSIDNDGHMIPSIVTRIYDVDAPEAVGINQKYAYIQNGDYDKDTFISYPISKGQMAKALREAFHLPDESFSESFVQEGARVNDTRLFEYLLAHQAIVLDRASNTLISEFEGTGKGAAHLGSQKFYGNLIRMNANHYAARSIIEALRETIDMDVNRIYYPEKIRFSADQPGNRDALLNIDAGNVADTASKHQSYRLRFSNDNVIVMDNKGTDLIDRWAVKGGLRTITKGRIRGNIGYFVFELSGVKYYAVYEAEKNFFGLKNHGVFVYGDDFNQKMADLGRAIGNNNFQETIDSQKASAITRDFGPNIRFTSPGLLSKVVGASFVDFVKSKDGLAIMKARISGNDDQKVQNLFSFIRRVEAASATILEAAPTTLKHYDNYSDMLDAVNGKIGNVDSYKLVAVPIELSDAIRKDLKVSGVMKNDFIMNMIALREMISKYYNIKKAVVIKNNFDGEGDAELVTRISQKIANYERVVETADYHLTGRKITDLRKLAEGKEGAEADAEVTRRVEEMADILKRVSANGNLDYLPNNLYLLGRLYAQDPDVLDSIQEGFRLPPAIRIHLTDESFDAIYKGKASLVPTSAKEVADLQNAIYGYNVAEYLLNNRGTLLTFGSLIEEAKSMGRAKVYIAGGIDSTDKLVAAVMERLRMSPLTSGNILSESSVREIFNSLKIKVDKTEGLAIMYSDEMREPNRTGLLSGFMINNKALKKEYRDMATMGKHGVFEMNGKHVTSEQLYNNMVGFMSKGAVNNLQRQRLKAVYTALTSVVDPHTQRNMMLLGEGITSTTLKELANAVQGHDGIDYKLDLSRLSDNFSFEINENSKLLVKAFLEDLGGPTSDIGFRTRTRGVCN